MKKIFFVTLLHISFLQLLNAQSIRHTGHHSYKQMRAMNSISDTIDILKYTINLNVTDFTNNIISGNTKVRFAVKYNNINQLNLDLLKLTIDSITSNSMILNSNYNDTLLKINLPVTLNIGDTSDVTVYYHGTPQIDASNWGGFYFQNGFAYNLGVGFDALPHVYGRAWFPCFDNFVERSKYEFNITTNNGKIAYCNGYLANDTTDGSGNRTRKWVMNEGIQSYLACVAVGNYTEINQTYNGINGVIPIKIAALPADTIAVKNSFVNLPVALSTFESHFGPYMWNKVGYSMIPFSSGAMEHATNIGYPKAFANGTTQYQTLYAHELSHHWFGDLATCRTPEDMWLNEGWAHYCEFLFTEALTGYGTYLTAVRTNHQDNLQYIQNKEGGYQTLSNIPQNITYGDHVYNKGADVAHTMRGYLGDSLFFYSVKTYLSNYNYKSVSSADFRDAVTNAIGINMNDFFDGWVFNPGWCHFSIDSTLVTPSGINYNVTVYVKQKLTGAPNYFNNVPLEITFKKADWTEEIKTISMSGANGTFTFFLPYVPAFTAINMGEKISHAIAPDYQKIKTTGTKNFSNAKMSINVTSITDSAFVRVEHNYTAPDGFKAQFQPYRLSPNHYWKVDAILPAVFKAKATLNYDGRTSSFSGSMWLDNLLITASEDSLVLMYRRNAADDWHVFPYQTKNTLGNSTDKRGTISIDTLQLGEYVMAMKDYTLGINPDAKQNAEKLVLKVFPNPAKDIITIDMYASFLNLSNNTLLSITDAIGKMVYKEKLNPSQSIVNISTSSLPNGIYFISVKAKDTLLGQTKVVISH